MTLALIAAIARNRVIGAHGELPWHIPEDMARFKRLTTGHTVLMGKRTYESIGRLLPGRRMMVLTTGPLGEVETRPSLPAALDALRNEGRVFVIGGGRVFAQTLDRADELYLTIVEKEYEGDTFFPPYEQLLDAAFEVTKREQHQGFRFEDYRKRLTEEQ